MRFPDVRINTHYTIFITSTPMHCAIDVLFYYSILF